jgi:hypothetical protein
MGLNLLVVGGLLAVSVYRAVSRPGPAGWVLVTGVAAVGLAVAAYFALARVRLAGTELWWRRPTGRSHRCDVAEVGRVVVVDDLVNLGGTPWYRAFVVTRAGVLRLHGFIWAPEDVERLVDELDAAGRDVHRYGRLSHAELESREPGVLPWTERHQGLTVLAGTVLALAAVAGLVVLLIGPPPN